MHIISELDGVWCFRYYMTSLEIHTFDKGGLNSESFSLWLKSLKKGAKALSAQNSLAPFLVNKPEIKKNSDIKSPLVNCN